MKNADTVSLILAIAISVPVAWSQTKLTGPVQIEAKRAELAQIQEQLTDPDPLKRQAAMITVIESADANKIQFALRIALSSTDASLRSLGLRAYLADIKELDFDVQSPPAIQQQLEAATNSTDPNRMDDLFKRFPHLRGLANAGNHFHMKLNNYSLSRTTGEAWSGGSTYSFSVSGDRVRASVPSALLTNTCAVAFQPQQIVKDGPLVLRGSLQCGPFYSDSVTPPLTITAPLF